MFVSAIDILSDAGKGVVSCTLVVAVAVVDIAHSAFDVIVQVTVHAVEILVRL